MKSLPAWSWQRNEYEQVDQSKREEVLRNFNATNVSFKSNYYTYCTLLQISPHPQLLPKILISQEGDQNLYIMEDNPTVQVRNWKMDQASIAGLCFCLQLPELTGSLLTTLCLFNVELQKTQVEMISLMLPSSTITTLLIEWNPLEKSAQDDDPSIVFVDLFAPNSKLFSISLRGNGISADAASMFAPRLPTMRQLRHLNLFGNACYDEGACCLAKYLPCTLLETFSLAQNKLTGIGCLSIVKSLTFYSITAEMQQEMENATSDIEAMLTAAKKEKKPMDRNEACQRLGVPLVIVVDGKDMGTGNRTLKDVHLSDNAVECNDVRIISETLIAHEEMLSEYLSALHLRRSKSKEYEEDSEDIFSSFLRL